MPVQGENVYYPPRQYAALKRGEGESSPLRSCNLRQAHGARDHQVRGPGCLARLGNPRTKGDLGNDGSPFGWVIGRFMAREIDCDHDMGGSSSYSHTEYSIGAGAFLGAGGLVLVQIALLSGHSGRLPLLGFIIYVPIAIILLSIGAFYFRRAMQVYGKSKAITPPSNKPV